MGTSFACWAPRTHFMACWHSVASFPSLALSLWEPYRVDFPFTCPQQKRSRSMLTALGRHNTYRREGRDDRTKFHIDMKIRCLWYEVSSALISTTPQLSIRNELVLFLQLWWSTVLVSCRSKLSHGCYTIPIAKYNLGSEVSDSKA